MLGEILRWVLANINVELAIVMWMKAGKPFWFTLAVMEILGVVTVLASYGSFSILFWVTKHVLGGFSFLKKKYDALRQGVHLNSKVFFSKIKRFLGSHKRLLLFLANLIPATPMALFWYNLVLPLPYFTMATIVVAKTAKIRYGLLCILVGNVLKILAEVCGVFYWDILRDILRDILYGICV